MKVSFISRKCFLQKWGEIMKVSRKMLRYVVFACCCFLAFGGILTPQRVHADWLRDLEAEAIAWMAEERSPGMAIAIVKNDVPIYVKGFGHLSVDPSSPLVNEDTVFMIGSTSKAFASAQLAVLADQKRLAWTDPVRKHLPSFRMFDPWVNAQMQVEDLLCHRSGMNRYSLTMMEVLNYPTGERIRGIRFQQPVTSFRTAFAYQNCMYIAAAKLAEAVAGKSWGESLSELIFGPLGMTRSVTTQAAVDAMEDVAPGHLRLSDGGLWPIPSHWIWNTIQDRSLAAAAVRTTAHDMAQWLRFQLSPGKLGDQQIVTEANMRYLHAPRVLVAPWAHNTDSPSWGSVSYCCGAWNYWGLSPQPFLFHDGGAMGSGSALGLVPGADIGIAVLTNIEGGDYLASKIVCRFYDLYFNRGTPPAELERNLVALRGLARPSSSRASFPLSAQASCRSLEDYCGVYSNPAYGRFIVRQSKGSLVITMGPGKIRANLVPAGPNAFTAYLSGYPKGYEMTFPMEFAFPSSGPATLAVGPMVGPDPKEVFSRMDE